MDDKGTWAAQLEAALREIVEALDLEATVWTDETDDVISILLWEDAMRSGAFAKANAEFDASQERQAQEAKA